MGFVEGMGLGKCMQGVRTFVRPMGQNHLKGVRAAGETKSGSKMGFASCMLCDKIFNGLDAVTVHCRSRRHVVNLRKHPSNRILTCTICKVTFSNQTLLRNHFRTVYHETDSKTGNPVPGLAHAQNRP
eukprot:UN05211